MTTAPVVNPRVANSTEFLVRFCVAAVVWFGGVFTTWLLIAALADQKPEVISLALFLNSDLLHISVAIQAVFTALESSIWAGRKPGLLTWAVLLVDTLINAGGLWQWVKNLPQTEIAVMLNETLGVQMGTTVALVVVALIGAALAYAPEGILRRG